MPANCLDRAFCCSIAFVVVGNAFLECCCETQAASYLLHLVLYCLGCVLVVCFKDQAVVPKLGSKVLYTKASAKCVVLLMPPFLLQGTARIALLQLSTAIRVTAGGSSLPVVLV